MTIEGLSKLIAGDVRRTQLRFVLAFVTVAAALLAIYSFPYSEHGIHEGWFTSYLAIYARLAGAALRLWDSTVTVTGMQINGQTSLTIAKNCDAMDVNIMFVAAVFAFPAAWSRRAFGICAGVIALIAVNVLRIVSLYFIRIHWAHAFEFVHAEVWPLALVVTAVLAFVAWSRWAVAVAPQIRRAVD